MSECFNSVNLTKSHRHYRRNNNEQKSSSKWNSSSRLHYLLCSFRLLSLRTKKRPVSELHNYKTIEKCPWHNGDDFHFCWTLQRISVNYITQTCLKVSNAEQRFHDSITAEKIKNASVLLMVDAVKRQTTSSI